MTISPSGIEELLKQLADTPERILSLSQGLHETQLRSRPNADAWSANDILAHLRACADVWGDSIQAMLTQDNPKLRYISPRTWIRKTDYVDLEFNASLQAFTAQRSGLLHELSSRSVDDWSRSEVIKDREQTVFGYVTRMAQHEMGHFDQLGAVLQAARDRSPSAAAKGQKNK